MYEKIIKSVTIRRAVKVK